MENPKMLSAKTKTIQVENDYQVIIPLSEIEKTDSGYKFTYYRVITKDKVYRISVPDGEAKIAAINSGSKFVKLEDDIVNINEIKTLSKKTAYKSN